MRGRGKYAPRGKTWKLAAFSSHPRELFRAVHRSNATGAASWLEGEYETGNDGGLVHQERDHRGENLFSPTWKLRSVRWCLFFLKIRH